MCAEQSTGVIAGCGDPPGPTIQALLIAGPNTLTAPTHLLQSTEASRCRATSRRRPSLVVPSITTSAARPRCSRVAIVVAPSDDIVDLWKDPRTGTYGIFIKHMVNEKRETMLSRSSDFVK